MFIPPQHVYFTFATERSDSKRPQQRSVSFGELCNLPLSGVELLQWLDVVAYRKNEDAPDGSIKRAVPNPVLVIEVLMVLRVRFKLPAKVIKR